MCWRKISEINVFIPELSYPAVKKMDNRSSEVNNFITINFGLKDFVGVYVSFLKNG